MGGVIGQLLAREQKAFLGRDRAAWGEHLSRVRAFLGAGLARADRDQPLWVLGAGSGLEVPWSIAPPRTLGWDADPWSRLRTFLRHRRWPAWSFEDLTGGLADLDRLARRCAREGWGRQRARPLDKARSRLAGLLPSLPAEPEPFRRRLCVERPGTILSANVMGQFGSVAQQLLARRLGAWWEDPFPPEDLAAALEAWLARLLRAQLQVLAGSGAELWLVYDRGVLHGGRDLSLGAWTDPWPDQVGGSGTAELEDPWAGVDPGRELAAAGLALHQRDRWLWPVAPGQTHLVEATAWQPALAVRRRVGTPHPGDDGGTAPFAVEPGVPGL